MQKTIKSRLARGLFLDRDIARLREQLAQIQRLPSRQNRMSGAALTEFDAVTELAISEIFGEASDFAEIVVDRQHLHLVSHRVQRRDDVVLRAPRR